MPGQGTTLSQSTSAFSSTLDIDTSTADVITVVLTANVTSMTLNYGGSGLIPTFGQRFLAAIGGKCDWRVDRGAAGRILRIDPLLTARSDTGANRINILPIRYNGTNWEFFRRLNRSRLRSQIQDVPSKLKSRAEFCVIVCVPGIFPPPPTVRDPESSLSSRIFGSPVHPAVMVVIVVVPVTLNIGFTGAAIEVAEATGPPMTSSTPSLLSMMLLVIVDGRDSVPVTSSATGIVLPMIVHRSIEVLISMPNFWDAGLAPPPR